MNEKEMADRFISEVDNMLNEAGRCEDNLPGTTYHQTLHTARFLVEADFSPESKIRDSLRQRLVNIVGAREKWNRRKEFSMRFTILKRHPILSFAIVLLMAFFTVALISPKTAAAVAQEVANFINKLELGNFTSIRQLDPEWASEHPQPPPTGKTEIEYRDDLWTLRTPIGNFGGNPPPGRENVIHKYDSLSDTQDMATFGVLSPAYLPEGYSFREGMIAPSDWVFLFYDGPQGDIVLAQIPVFTRTESQTKNTITTYTNAVGMVTDDPIHETLVNGIPAGWIEGNGLIWESEGISYMLGGVNLGLEETLLIAESLE